MTSPESSVVDAHADTIARLARAVTADCAPEELPLFSSVFESYRTSPDALRPDGSGKDDTLGFGVQEIATFITPIVVALSDSALRFLVDLAKDSLREELKLAIQRLLRPEQPPEQALAARAPVGLPLTSEEALRLRQVVAERARDLRVPEEKARLLADSILAHIAFGAETS